MDHNRVEAGPLNHAPPVAAPPNQRSRPKGLLYLGELPRSFSAPSYHDLTFVFSVAAGSMAIPVFSGIAYGVVAAVNKTRNKTRRGFEDSNYVTFLPVSKQERVSEDEGSDSLSSPLKRDLEPAPPSL